MLDKTKLIYLNREKRYDEIKKIFDNEYSRMLYKFFEINNIKVEKGLCTSYLINLLSSNFYGQYKDVCQILVSVFSDEDLKSEESIIIAVDNYNHVKQRLMLV